MKYTNLFAFVAVMGFAMYVQADVDMSDREDSIQEEMVREVVIDTLDTADAEDADSSSIAEDTDDSDSGIVSSQDELMLGEEDDGISGDAERCPCSRPQEQTQPMRPSNQQSIYGRPNQNQTYYPQRPAQPMQPNRPAYPSYRPRP